VQLDRRERDPSPHTRPIVPRTLRIALARQPLPQWLREATALPAGATVEALRPELLDGAPEALRRRVEHLAKRLFDSHRACFRDIRIADRPWPPGCEPCVVDWGDELRQRLAEVGLTDDRAVLEATYGDLLARPRLGARSVYAIAVAAQAALDPAYAGVDLPQGLHELAHAAAASPWAAVVSGEDPRFSDLFAGESGTLADRLEAAASSPPDAAHAAMLALRTTLPAAVERIGRIEATSLDVAMRGYLSALSGLDGELLDAVVRRLGLDGGPPRTLAESVNGSTVGRERVRRLQARLIRRVPSRPVYMPALDHALDLVTRAAPASAAEVARSIQQHGISTIPFHPAGVIMAARLCSRTVEFEVVDSPEGALVLRRGLRGETERIIRIASRLASSFGAASLRGVSAAAAALEIRVSGPEAREVLTRYCGAQFLDADWFWLPVRARNRLRTLTRRILAVCSPLDVATVLAGVHRAYGGRDIDLLPPLRVIAALFATDDAFAVDRRGRVRAAKPFDWRKELGKNDQIFVDALRCSREGILGRAAFHDACVARGMTSNMFNNATRLSVVLDNPFRGAWCLRGTQVTPAAAATLRPARA
jgi:sarcosine oxidase gamma subunit